MKTIIRTIAIGGVVLAGIVVVDGLFSSGIFMKEARAIIGKPGRVVAYNREYPIYSVHSLPLDLAFDRLEPPPGHYDRDCHLFTGCARMDNPAAS